MLNLITDNHPVLIGRHVPSRHPVGYYVSALDGDDENSGREPRLAWKTVERINTFVFEPGDTISFRLGDSWNTPLILSRGGTSESLLVFSNYGRGMYGSGIIPTIHLLIIKPEAEFIKFDGLKFLYIEPSIENLKNIYFENCP